MENLKTILNNTFKDINIVWYQTVMFSGYQHPLEILPVFQDLLPHNGNKVINIFEIEHVSTLFMKVQRLTYHFTEWTTYEVD